MATAISVFSLILQLLEIVFYIIGTLAFIKYLRKK